MNITTKKVGLYSDVKIRVRSTVTEIGLCDRCECIDLAKVLITGAYDMLGDVGIDVFDAHKLIEIIETKATK